jgi:large subunit ribosomal protein L29
MRAEEIREMSAQDIQGRIRELEDGLFRLKFRSATEPLEDPLQLRVLRKDIARLNTVLREKLGQGESASSAAPATKTAAGKAPAKRAQRSATTKKGAAKKAPAKKTTRASR